jgi:hypothetical protein
VGLFYQAPSEPKTFANLFKNPGAYNGTTTGLPSTVPPFGSVKSTTTTSSTSTAAAAATAPVTQVVVLKSYLSRFRNFTIYFFHVVDQQ